MAWTEVDLLKDLGNIYKRVSPKPVETVPTDDKGVSYRQVSVFDVAEADGVRPSGDVKNIDYYVLDAGTAEESAYYQIKSVSSAPIERIAVEARVAEVEAQAAIDAKTDANPLPPIIKPLKEE